MSDNLSSGDETQAVQIGNDFVEIHDPEIDPQQIIGEIRQRIRQRRLDMGYDKRNFPTFGAAAVCPEPPDDQPYPPDLYHHLRQANDLFANVETGAILASSPATRLPVLGRIWKLIREQAHGLVLFYVNRSVAHQVNVNRHLVSVLNQLTLQNQEQARQIATLEAKLNKAEHQSPA